MKKQARLFFNPGDVVLFRKTKRIVLEKVRTIEGDNREMYHIFSPGKGVYTAADFELEYINHLDEWEVLMGKMNEISLAKAG